MYILLIGKYKRTLKYSRKKKLVSAFAHTFAIIKILYKALVINSPSETSPTEEAANKKKKQRNNLQKNCLSVIDHFVGLAFKRLNIFLLTINCMNSIKQCQLYTKTNEMGVYVCKCRRDNCPLSKMCRTRSIVYQINSDSSIAVYKRKCYLGSNFQRALRES